MLLKRKISIIPVILLLAFTLSSCNTIQGMGEDIEKAGQEIEETAREVKHEI
jgi:predicted small secreted protein